MNIQLFDNATVRVDAENLVCITDIYNIAIERGLDGGKTIPATGLAQSVRSSQVTLVKQMTLPHRDANSLIL